MVKLIASTDKCSVIPVDYRAYKLLHDGVLELSRVESVGMRIDVARLKENRKVVENRIVELESELKNTDVWSTWRKVYGEKANLGSRYQLGKVLFGELGYEPVGFTGTGRVKVDEKALSLLEIPFVQKYLEMEKLKKALSTYIRGIEREVVDGYLHPVFNLHLVKTYRSSCEMPNFQNIPIRDETVGRLIRTCFVPREGHVLIECDYGALEFRIAACFWKDSKMVEYARDSTKDIHRDMASKCFLLPVEEVPKQVRFYAKNQFVFPQLYGSYYVSCAKNLWKFVPDLSLSDGTSMEEHLRKNGIVSYNQFEEHIKDVENYFNSFFREWSRGKEEWVANYFRRGYFKMMTGFVCSGVMSKNELYNWPIQGPAFHCLLFSLIRLNRFLRKHSFRSVIIGQIHDSIVADVHRDEISDFVNEAVRIMTDELSRKWDWVIVPMAVEVEIAENNWFEKRPYAHGK